MRSRRLLPVLALAILLAPEAAEGCPVCFQGVESPLLDSARAGVITMAIVLIGVLGAFARWFARLARLDATTSPEDERS
jgi:hypothetical protein